MQSAFPQITKKITILFEMYFRGLEAFRAENDVFFYFAQHSPHIACTQQVVQMDTIILLFFSLSGHIHVVKSREKPVIYLLYLFFTVWRFQSLQGNFQFSGHTIIFNPNPKITFNKQVRKLQSQRPQILHSLQFCRISDSS